MTAVWYDPMKRTSATPLASSIGARLRALREQHGALQDEVAASARQWGLSSWTRATVAAIETGRRQLSIEEFLLVPYVLRWSCLRTATEGVAPKEEVKKMVPELADLFPDDGWITLTPETSILPEAIRAILSSHAWDVLDVMIDTPKSRQERALIAEARVALPRYEAENKAIWQAIWPEAKIPVVQQFYIQRDALRDAEQKAAHKLGVPALAVSIAAYKRWGRSLTEERDRRVGEQVISETAPRTLQAIRGHVTRVLLTEIASFVSKLRKRSRSLQSS